MKKTAVKLKHINFNMKEHGFVGHLAEPEQTNGKAVIVICLLYTSDAADD